MSYYYYLYFFFFNDTATTEIYTLSLHDALPISIDHNAPMLASVGPELRVWASHGDFVKTAPPGFTVTATSSNAPVAAMSDETRRFYALLFHPEVAHTDKGTEILRNFAFDICGCTGDWTMASFVEESVGKIKEQVGN